MECGRRRHRFALRRTPETTTANGDGSTANRPLQGFVRLLSPPEKLEKLEKVSTSVSAGRVVLFRIVWN